VPQETEDTCGAVLDWCDRNLGFARDWRQCHVAMSTKRLRELLDEATKDVHDQLSSLAENGPRGIQGNSSTCNQGTTGRQQFVPHL
jgi:hypothetical protein